MIALAAADPVLPLFWRKIKGKWCVLTLKILLCIMVGSKALMANIAGQTFLFKKLIMYRYSVKSSKPKALNIKMN